MVSTLRSILVHPADGDMAQYMESPENLTRLPVRMVLRSHGPGSSQGVQLLEKQLAHRRMRQAAVAACLDDGILEMQQIVARVYEGLPREMHEYAALSVRSILNKLSAEGRAEAEGVS